MSKVQVLVATMRQTGFDKYATMKLHTDAVFANQADDTSYKCETFENHQVEMVTTATRGVGINRNIALMYSKSEVLLIADDDMEYVDGYENMVIEAFSRLPYADCLIFNIETKGKKTCRRENHRIKRVHFLNALNYGAARIAVKRDRIVREGITFNHNFGGGCIFSAGEDVLFVVEMLKHGLRIYTYPAVIGEVDQTTSTWFTGYNEKFFYDKGALFEGISRRWSLLLCLQAIVRHWDVYRESGLSKKRVLQLMLEGRKGYDTLTGYTEK